MSDFTFEVPMTVEELKEINFDRLSKQEKLRVKLRGRPTPIIQLSCPSKCHGKIYIKSFKENIFMKEIGYVQVMWIIHYIVSLVYYLIKAPGVIL